MANSKQTGKKVSRLASEVLRNTHSSSIQKELAGSALAQTSTDKQPSKEIEEKAAKVLVSDKYSEVTKSLAATVLSQADSTN